MDEKFKTIIYLENKIKSQEKELRQVRNVLTEVQADFGAKKEIIEALEKTIEILGMSAIKLSNIIGLSKDFRKELLDTLKESYKSFLQKKNEGAVTEND